MKILAAMSGGVDSSVAAAMLVRDGHDVTGVHLRLTEQTEAQEGRVHGCCGIADADDARRVAQVLDIPFYVWNFKEAFAHGVIDDFVGEYARGRTPNPCVRCNETVKFGALRRRALSLGFAAVATGHYAQTRLEGGRWHLYRSADAEKDQSYVLARTGQEELATARFPVGVQLKDETRALAREIGLRTADKPDSYEICFVPDGDAGGFVEKSIEISPGEIVGSDGAVLGEHPGIHRYTIGQRRGLGVCVGQCWHKMALFAFLIILRETLFSLPAGLAAAVTSSYAGPQSFRIFTSISPVRKRPSSTFAGRPSAG